MTSQSTDNIWLTNPLVLFKKNQIHHIWPKEYMSKNEKINSITRLVLILTILGSLITQTYTFFYTGLITLGVIAVLYYVRDYNKNNEFQQHQTKEQKEGFTNPKVYEALKTNLTNPTTQNPLMNVLIPEIKDDPNRKMAAPAYNSAVEKKINENTEDFVVSNFDNDPAIKKKLFSTLGDSFEFEDFGQYNFYATANTRVENDQKSFAEFCYGGMVSGKEGNDFALLQNAPRTGAVAWQN